MNVLYSSNIYEILLYNRLLTTRGKRIVKQDYWRSLGISNHDIDYVEVKLFILHTLMVDNKSGYGLVLNRQLAITWTNVDPLHNEACSMWLTYLCMQHV